jgi:hypothetical protein
VSRLRTQDRNDRHRYKHVYVGKTMTTEVDSNIIYTIYVPTFTLRGNSAPVTLTASPVVVTTSIRPPPWTPWSRAFHGASDIQNGRGADFDDAGDDYIYAFSAVSV